MMEVLSLRKLPDSVKRACGSLAARNVMVTALLGITEHEDQKDRRSQ